MEAFAKNTKQITEISKKLNILEDNYLINGLTSVKINLSIETNTFGFLSKNNKICVIPEDVKIFITFDSPVIYISEDLKNKPCQNNLTTYHELTHHHINIKTFEYYLPLFKLAAEKVIKETSPISVSNKNDINKISLMLSKKYNDRLSPLVNHIYKEMEKQQRYLDNKKNYEYEANICN